MNLGIVLSRHYKLGIHKQGIMLLSHQRCKNKLDHCFKLFLKGAYFESLPNKSTQKAKICKRLTVMESN